MDEISGRPPVGGVARRRRERRLRSMLRHEVGITQEPNSERIMVQSMHRFRKLRKGSSNLTMWRPRLPSLGSGGQAKAWRPLLQVPIQRLQLLVDTWIHHLSSLVRHQLRSATFLQPPVVEPMLQNLPTLVRHQLQ